MHLKGVLDDLEGQGYAQCIVVACVTKDGRGARLLRVFDGCEAGHIAKMVIELELQSHALKAELLKQQESVKLGDYEPTTTEWLN